MPNYMPSDAILFIIHKHVNLEIKRYFTTPNPVTETAFDSASGTDPFAEIDDVLPSLDSVHVVPWTIPGPHTASLSPLTGFAELLP